MDLSTAVKEFLSAKRTLSPLTVRSYKQRLCVFADWCTQHGFTLETLTARAVRTFIEDMGHRPGLGGHPMQNSTVHCYATDVKTFLSWCAREEDFEGLVSTRIVARVESPPVETKVIEVFTDVQIAAFFRAAEEGDSAVRDRALFRVSPHTFRHGFACAYLIAGGDLYKLSRLMGHTSVKVTERYLGAIKARQARQGGYSVLDHLKD